MHFNHTIKHLEMIQNIISRLAQNSFTYKGWAITLVAAVFIIWTNTSQYYLLLVALIPTFSFWGLDAYYLRQERLYRALYDDVRGMKDIPYENLFSMDTSPFNSQVSSWLEICWSKTIKWLYVPIILLILVITCIACINGDC